MTEITKASLDRALGFDLSDEQWAVVSSPLEPAVVVAGAGSGKTTTMSARIAWLIASEAVAPDAVLGLTFTKKAAAGLLTSTRRHLRALETAGLVVVPDVDDDALRGEPVISTYHAFAGRILDEHGIRLGREPGARILTDGAREQLAYRVVCRSSLPLHDLGATPVNVTGSMLELDDQISELDITPDDLVAAEEAFIARLGAFDSLQVIGQDMQRTARTRLLLARLIGEWRAEKAARGVLDFSDQARLALELARAFPDVVASVRARYGVVLLDEYQDTSLAQRALLQALFGEGHPVTAVGDPCQAIYGWRGASVDNIEHFVEHFPVVGDGSRRTARYVLKSNRRSGPAILAVANDLSADLRARHSGVEALESAATGKGPGVVRVGLFETSAQEKSWIADEIAGFRPGAGTTWSDIAVLASTGRDLVEIDALLRARGIPTQLYGAAGLLRQPVVVDVRSVLEVMHDPIANPALLRILSGPRWRIGPRDLAALGTRAATLAGGHGRREVRDVGGALDDAVAGTDPVETVSLSDAVLDLGDPQAYSPQAYERLEAFAAELLLLRRHAGEPMTDLIARVAQVIGLDIEMSLSADPEQQQYAWASFLELAADFSDMDGGATLGAFLARLRDAERFDTDLDIDLARVQDAVQLLTIHKAKGLEFPHVFVMSLAQDAFPGGMKRGEWPTSPTAVPWRLRSDGNAALSSFPDLTQAPRAKDHKAYREVLQELQQADADRLAYVALTRAERTLIVTGHWWGHTQRTPRGPGPYLQQVKDTAEGLGGDILIWHPGPEDGAVNPSPQARATDERWPSALANADAREAAAAAVHAHLMAPPALPGMPVTASGLTEAERVRVEQWSADADALLAELRARHASVVRVPLPASMSASAAIAAMRDPQSFALDLARPMPSAPSLAARRGTAFHAWVETRYGQQSLIDPDDLPGAGDDDITSDARLVELQAAFERSVYANRAPVAVEEPFVLVIGGRVLRGRIDAVFADGDRFDVIDWKTGSAASVDPLQLALYRIAWSQVRGIPLDRIDAGFLIVATGEVIRPEGLPSLREIERMLVGG